MDGGAWWAAVHGVAKSRTWLSDFTLTFHFHASEKEMATHSSVLAWRIPGMGEPGGLLSMGSHRVGHDWSDLAAVVAVQERQAPRTQQTRWSWNRPYGGLGAAQGGENEPWEGKELAVGTALGVLAGLVWALLLDAGCTLCLCLGLLLLWLLV